MLRRSAEEPELEETAADQAEHQAEDEHSVNTVRDVELFDIFDGTDPSSEMLVDLQQKLKFSLARADFYGGKDKGMYERAEMRDARSGSGAR